MNSEIINTEIMNTKPTGGRVGRVARLPLQARTIVNQALRDGVPYKDIVSKLFDSGHPGISPDSIGSWAGGGYRDWLAKQEFSEMLHPLGSTTQSLLAQVGPDAIPKEERRLRHAALIESYIKSKNQKPTETESEI